MNRARMVERGTEKRLGKREGGKKERRKEKGERRKDEVMRWGRQERRDGTAGRR